MRAGEISIPLAAGGPGLGPREEHEGASCETTSGGCHGCDGLGAGGADRLWGRGRRGVRPVGDPEAAVGRAVEQFELDGDRVAVVRFQWCA